MKPIKHKGKLTRTFNLGDLEGRAAIDEENRTVELVFSSEEPVERFFGTEILDHDASSVRLDRLNNGAALLVDHDTRDHVGVVESATIGADRRGRAVVRFGRSDRAEEVFRDVVDNIRQLVSVGYRIHKVEEDRDKETYRAVDWQPHEISIVSVPADATVGVGRNIGEDEYEIDVVNRSRPPEPDVEIIEPEEKSMSDEKKEVRSEIDPKEEQRKADELFDNAIKKTRSDWDQIRAMGEAHNAKDEAEKAIADGHSPEQFRQLLLDRYVNQVKPMDTPLEEVTMSRKEEQRYSVRKAIAALSNPNNRSLQDAAGFEFEVSMDIAKRTGRPAQGLYVPAQAFHQRTLTAGTATDGAELVATNLRDQDYIDVLSNRMKVMQFGPTVLDGLSGDVAIPRKTSGNGSGWIATEGGDAANVDPQFDQVTLTPRTIGNYIDYTRQLMLQSTPAIDGLVQQDLALGMALGIDLAALEGSGAAGQPTGLRNQTGVNTVTITTAGSPTWAEVVDFETQIAIDNADVANMGWIIRAAVRGNMKTTEKAATTAQFIMDGNEVNGYRAEVSEQGAANSLYFGNWADLLLGFWGALDVLVDPYTNSRSGTVRVVALQSADVAVRHPESFCINA